MHTYFAEFMSMAAAAGVPLDAFHAPAPFEYMRYRLGVRVRGKKVTWAPQICEEVTRAIVAEENEAQTVEEAAAPWWYVEPEEPPDWQKEENDDEEEAVAPAGST